MRIKAHCLLHQYDKVLEDAEQNCRNIFEDIRSQMHICMYFYYYSISLAALFHAAGSAADLKGQTVAKLKENLAAMEPWYKNSAVNCEHRYKLVEAELAVINGNNEEALSIFEYASQIATERGFHHHNALILERTAMFHLVTGDEEQARAVLCQSLEAYMAWGASAVVSMLVNEHRDLLDMGSFLTLGPVSASNAQNGVDVEAVLACGSAVSESPLLGKLLNTFLSFIVNKFSASYGCVLLKRPDGVLLTHARMNRYPGSSYPCTLLHPPLPLADTFKDKPTCSMRAVRCAMLLGRAIVVNDISGSGIKSDAHFRDCLARSVLCMPMVLRGIAFGAVFLEDSKPDAFDRGNVDTLQLMCAQVISFI